MLDLHQKNTNNSLYDFIVLHFHAHGAEIYISLHLWPIDTSQNSMIDISINDLSFIDTFSIILLPNIRRNEIMIEHEGRTYFYARVSSKSQNLDRQIELFKSMGGIENENIIVDKESGKDFNREGYAYLKKQLLRKGDTLVIKELDRLGRNKEAIKEELEHFKEIGIRIKVTDLPTTMTDIPFGQEWIIDMINNILIEVLSSIAEQERLKINSRQKEGIAAMEIKNGKRYSTKTGRPIGRPPATYPLEWNRYYEKWKAGEITAVECMRQMNLKRCTFYKLVHNMEG